MHMQCVQVYALSAFYAQPAWKLPIDSWDLASVLCAHDVVTEMAVALHAIGVNEDDINLVFPTERWKLLGMTHFFRVLSAELFGEMELHWLS